MVLQTLVNFHDRGGGDQKYVEHGFGDKTLFLHVFGRLKKQKKNKIMHPMFL